MKKIQFHYKMFKIYSSVLFVSGIIKKKCTGWSKIPSAVKSVKSIMKITDYYRVWQC